MMSRFLILALLAVGFAVASAWPVR